MKKRTIIMALSIPLIIILCYILFNKIISKNAIYNYDSSNTNLIFISIDTLRADHLGIYGYQRNTSPNIDDLAKQKILFKNFFTVVPKTGPSMTSFFTGRQINRHGVVSNWCGVNKDEKVLAALLPSHYLKAAFVNNITLNRKRGYNIGFDTYNLFNKLSPSKFTDHVISWLNENNEKRFFLWVHYLDPHGPYLPPDKFKTLFVNDRFYDGSKKVKIPSKPDINAFGLGQVPFYQVLDNHDEIDYYISQYDAEIFNIDIQIGRLVQLFEKKGLFENSVIILTSDHGESLGEDNYFFEHGLLLNKCSIHIPFIMSHPAITKPMVIDQLADNTDFLPTILSLFGLSPPQRSDGIDLKELFIDNNMSTKPHIISQTPMEYPTYQKMIIGNGYRFLENGKNVKTDKRTYVKNGKVDYAYFKIFDGVWDSENIIDQLDEKKSKKFISIIHQMTDNKDPSVKTNDIKLSEDTLKELRSLGYVE